MKLGLIECFFDGNEIQCLIEGKDIVSYKLYWNTDNVSIDEDKLILTSDLPDVRFQRPIENTRRVYFVLVFEDGTIVKTAERILPIAGMYNFRDMGGYPTKDGKRVKWGKLYRGDHLHNLKPEGYSYVESLKLKSIIDFRSAVELEQYPNIVVDKATVSYNFDPDAHTAAFAGSIQNNEFMHDGEKMTEIARQELALHPQAGDQKMIDQQIAFVNKESSQKAFRDTLITLMDPEAVPAFEHCKGGKDRTGFAAMIQLALLGVDKKYLIYDYMLTRKAREKKNLLYYQRFMKITGDEVVANYFYSLFDTKESYILAAIKAIESAYSTVENYVKTVYKVSDEDLRHYRELYLED